MFVKRNPGRECAPRFKVFNDMMGRKTPTRVYEVYPGITNNQINKLVGIAKKEAKDQVQRTIWEVPASIPESGMAQILQFVGEYDNVGLFLIRGRMSASAVLLLGDSIGKYVHQTDFISPYPMWFIVDFNIFTDSEVAFDFARRMVTNRFVNISVIDHVYGDITNPLRAYRLFESVRIQAYERNALTVFASAYHTPRDSLLKTFLVKDGDFAICRRIHAFLIEYRYAIFK